jgi:hypothetical protein
MDDDNITKHKWTSVNISKNILLTRLCPLLLLVSLSTQSSNPTVLHLPWIMVNRLGHRLPSAPVSSNMDGYKNPCSLMFPSPSIGFPSCSQAHCGRYIPHFETPIFSHIAGMTPMILPGFFHPSFLMPIMLCHVWLPNIKWSHLTGQQSLTGQLPRLLGGLIKGSIHVRHQPQDQGDAVDVGHGPLPQEKAGLENPPRMLGDWRFWLHLLWW